MKRAIGIMCIVAGGCAGGDRGPVGTHEEAVASASLADVEDLGVDESGCGDPASAGGQAVPVAGRPDLVGVTLDGALVCLTTVDRARASGMDLSQITGAAAVALMAIEPQPQPYDEDEGDGGDDGEGDDEPQPQPYVEPDDTAGGDADDPKTSTSTSTDTK